MNNRLKNERFNIEEQQQKHFLNELERNDEMYPEPPYDARQQEVPGTISKMQPKG